MRIRKFLIVFLMSIIAFTEITKAIPVSNTYEQGIYNLSDIKEFNATVKLITPNNITSLIIVDSKGNPKFYKRFDAENESVNLTSIRSGDIISIIGDGEIAITYS